jgi:hypothetical protein
MAARLLRQAAIQSPVGFDRALWPSPICEPPFGNAFDRGRHRNFLLDAEGEADRSVVRLLDSSLDARGMSGKPLPDMAFGFRAAGEPLSTPCEKPILFRDAVG